MAQLNHFAYAKYHPKAPLTRSPKRNLQNVSAKELCDNLLLNGFASGQSFPLLKRQPGVCAVAQRFMNRIAVLRILTTLGIQSDLCKMPTGTKSISRRTARTSPVSAVVIHGVCSNKHGASFST